MLKTEISLEAVTPVFLRGADKEPELRPPSFRGEFRYWFRALAGAVIGDKNTRLLKELESRVWGDTETGSPIKIRILQASENEDIGGAYILPHKEVAWRKAYEAGQEITLVISALGLNEDAWEWKAAIASVKLAFTFGGVGLRSRRGYGTLRIVGDTGGYFMTFPTTIDGWKNHIDKVIRDALDVFKTSPLLSKKTGAILKQPLPGPAKYPCLNQSSHIRLTGSEWEDCDEAISDFMGKSYKATFLGFVRGKNRQASPLWVRVVDIEDEYSLLMITLPSDFHGSNYGELDYFMNNKFSGTDLHVEGLNK